MNAPVDPRTEYSSPMPELTKEQRRGLIALACKVAWADGVVSPEERAQVLDLVRRHGDASLSERELDAWLETGGPEVELASVPSEVGETFFHEATEVMRADGEMATEEMELVCQVMSRVFAHEPQGTPISKIRLVKRAVPK